MTLLIFAALASGTLGALSQVRSADGTEFAQMAIRQTVVVRVPSTPPPPQRIKWREKKTRKCVTVAEMGGYAITQPDSIDLIVKGGTRYRAKLASDCPSIAFYSGFYIHPPADGRICARRDSFHSRTGGECAIEKLHLLVPEH